MNKKIISLGLVLTISLSSFTFATPLVTQNASGVAQDQDYYTQDVRNTRIIFTEQNKTYAEHAAAVERLFLAGRLGTVCIHHHCTVQ